MKNDEKLVIMRGVVEAGDLVEGGKYSYTCLALHEAGLSLYDVENYWGNLFYINVGRESKRTVESSNEFCGIKNLTEKELLEQRLIMLAWFYEMVRSGEYAKNFM